MDDYLLDAMRDGSGSGEWRCWVLDIRYYRAIAESTMAERGMRGAVSALTRRDRSSSPRWIVKKNELETKSWCSAGPILLWGGYCMTRA